MIDRWKVITPVRARYADTDKMGVVYYGRYMELFEVGRTEWIRTCWRPYVEVEREGVFLPVVHAAATYRKSFFYDDLIQVAAFPIGYTNTRIRFGYELCGNAEDEIRVTGVTEHAFIDENGKLVRLPEGLLGLLKDRVPNVIPPLFHKPA
ncbi:MAG: acyl-CoA thioesterase [bacterium]|nr:acyl-CoA thioesterase [bacterium]